MIAAMRTQFLHAVMIEEMLKGGGYRLVPIRDHEALARSIPGTKAGFIPAGLYGPGRRIPAEPVPTLTVTQLLIARGDLPGRAVRDILGVIYHPRFARDLQYDIREDAGRIVGGLPLHPAAHFYYHRNDLLTAERLGRFSLVASAIAAFVATFQFMTRLRRRVARRRRTDADAPDPASADFSSAELASAKRANAEPAIAEPTSEEPLEKRVEL
jgi:hypothetical protein